MITAGARFALSAERMTISALVLTLDQKNLETTLAMLDADSRLELGERFSNRVPVVAETSDSRAGRDLVEQLRDAPGVVMVDVVLVDFSQEQAS